MKRFLVCSLASKKALLTVYMQVIILSIFSQVDPYDYDIILFILKLVKELSPAETSTTVDKVKLSYINWTYVIWNL